jgi:hypothetical protein
MCPAWRYSRSGEKCSQKLVTANTPCAPAKARASEAGSSRSPCAISAPAWASATAAGESGLRVIAAQCELAGRVGEDRARESAALGAGGADDCNDGFG